MGARLTIGDADEIYRSMLTRLGRTPSQSFGEYLNEVRSNQILRAQFEHQTEARNITKYRSWDDRIDRLKGNIALYYALIRETGPKTLVETGTASGSMTSILLSALDRNEAGELISIDIPPKSGQLGMQHSIERENIGFHIPEKYRARWSYIEGDAKVHLPRVLAEKTCDVFIHDSLHTRTHMMFEYSVARALLPEDAIIISDDITMNESFLDFVGAHRLDGFIPLENMNIGATISAFEGDDRETLGLKG